MLSSPVRAGGMKHGAAARVLCSSPSDSQWAVVDGARVSPGQQRRKSAQLKSQNRLVRKLPFEEYLKTWTQMGTTEAGFWMKNSYPEGRIQHPETLEMLFKSPVKESSMDAQPEIPQKTYPSRNQRQAKMYQMRKIYMLGRTPDSPTPPESMQGDSVATRGLYHAPDNKQQDLWENETNQLVAWARSLSFQQLED